MNNIYSFLFASQVRKYTILSISIITGFLFFAIIYTSNSSLPYCPEKSTTDSTLPLLSAASKNVALVLTTALFIVGIFLVMGYLRNNNVSLSRNLETGTVKWFDVDKGYGLIAPDTGGPDVSVRMPAVEYAGLDELHEGQRIGYKLVRGRNSENFAENLKPIKTRKNPHSYRLLERYFWAGLLISLLSLLFAFVAVLRDNTTAAVAFLSVPLVSVIFQGIQVGSDAEMSGLTDKTRRRSRKL